MQRQLFVFPFLILATAACASKSTTPVDPTSTVQGRMTAATFKAAPTAVEAIDETGKRIRAGVAADGAFKLDLGKGHTYKLVVLTGAGEEALVFPREGGRLDRTFRVSSGAAVVDLGGVRHMDAAPAGGFTVASGAGAIRPKSGDGEVGECVDGFVKGTGAACVDDDEKTSCEGGEQSDGDGECENGKDAKTGAPCTDNDSAGEEDADPTKPMAVPEKNPPNDVSGCSDGSDGDGEEADD